MYTTCVNTRVVFWVFAKDPTMVGFGPTGCSDYQTESGLTNCIPSVHPSPLYTSVLYILHQCSTYDISALHTTSVLYMLHTTCICTLLCLSTMVRKPPPIGTIATIGIALGLGLKFPCYTAVISGSDRRRIENPWCIALFIRFSTSCYLLITLVLLHWLKGRPSYKTTDCSISVISLLYLYYISLGWRIRTDTRCWVYGYWWWSWVRRTVWCEESGRTLTGCTADVGWNG